MREIMSWRTLLTVFTVAAIVYSVRTRQSHGNMLGIPFEWRLPTAARLRERLWNPEDPRLFTPLVFGVGWSVNLYHVVTWLRGYADVETPR